MMRTFFSLLTVFTAFVCVGCSNSNQPHDHVSNKAQNTAATAPTTTFGGAYKIELTSAPAQVVSGEPAEILLTVKNERGEIARNLEIVHEKLMHVIIVSEDLTEFYHEHPKPRADGALKLNFTFPNGGKYRLFADFKPQGADQTVQNFPLQVAGAERPPRELRADEKLEKTQDNLRFALKFDGELQAGTESRLNFEVFDAASGKPVADLENYLGAKAHIVVIGQDLNEYVHAHQLSHESAKHDHQHGANTTGDGKIAENSEAAATVAADVAFPKPGLYKIWAQFQRQGKILTVPFVVSVKKAKEEKTVLDEVKIPAGAIKIVVSRDGFTPEEISLKKEQPLKLAFIRTDAENCADEIVFKELNIRRKLPVGEVVTIDLPATASGEVNFTCGMNMFKGKIVVQ